jgi:hypothetical protein
MESGVRYDSTGSDRAPDRPAAPRFFAALHHWQVW